MLARRRFRIVRRGGRLVDAGRLEVDAAVLARVDMSAKDESRALLGDGRGQLRRAEMLEVRLERTINVASRYARHGNNYI